MSDVRTRKKSKRYIFIVCITWLSVFIPLCFPIGLPIEVSELTIEFRNYLDSLPEESIILHSANTYSGSIRGTIVVIKYLIKNNLKWVGWSDSARSAAYTMECLEIAGAFEATDWVYGVDWVWLGYIAGAEAAHSAIRDDFQSIAVSDYKGVPISELPLLQEIHSETDIDLFLGSGESHLIWSRLWPTKPDRPTLLIIPTDIFPATIPYYPQTFAGLINGLGGAGELEFLLGMPGRAIAASDALSLATIVTTLACILAQIEVIKGEKVTREIKVDES